MASTDAKAIPQKNVALRITFPIFDADGDLVTGATGLDSEVSKDGGTFADCTNEATEIATSSGMYYLDLTNTEMNADTVAIIVKTTTTGAKTTPIVLYTAARSINDLAFPTTSGRSMDVDASGGVEVGSFQTGAITAGAFTAGAIDAAAIAANAIGASEIATGAITALKFDIGAITSSAFAAGAIDNAAIASNAIGAAEIATGAITNAKFAAGAIDAAAIATGAITNAKFAGGAIDAAAIATDAIGAAEIADGAITAATFAAGAIDATAIATDAIDADSLATDAVTEIQAGLATATAVTNIQSDTDDIQARLPATLSGGKMRSQVEGMDADTVTATAIATDAIDEDAVADDLDTYQVQVDVIDDDGGTSDRWIVVFHKNSIPVDPVDITTPVLDVFDASGALLFGPEALTAIPNTFAFSAVATGAERIVDGVAYVATPLADIDGSTRQWFKPIGRDS